MTTVTVLIRETKDYDKTDFEVLDVYETEQQARNAVPMYVRTDCERYATFDGAVGLDEIGPKVRKRIDDIVAAITEYQYSPHSPYLKVDYIKVPNKSSGQMWSGIYNQEYYWITKEVKR